MIFITGGYQQGKEQYARTYFPSYTRIQDYHLQLEQCVKDGIDPFIYTQTLITTYPHIVIIMDEMGCGMVPISQNDRKLRDIVGQVGCYLAAEATEVYRVIAGIGSKLK
ncbi:MAG: bifunctional adenosylcobinamide kinase/adenosylcobinamide-phosphate guanylyltransferase [Lachnospiraceae bacterium]